MKAYNILGMMKINLLVSLLVCSILGFYTQANASNSSFSQRSKSFVMLESDKGEKALAAIIQENDKTYALTTQSLFEFGFRKLQVFGFNDKKLTIKGFELSKHRNLLRIHIENDGSLQPIQISYDYAEGQLVYAMELKTGAVWQSYSLISVEEKLDTTGFMINESGSLCGMLTKTVNFSRGEDYRIRSVRFLKNDEWAPVSQKQFKNQIDKLLSLKKETQSVENIYERLSPNQYIPFSNKFHHKHFKWLTDHNIQYLNYILDAPREKPAQSNHLIDVENRSNISKKNAIREHKSRCFNYTELKRLLFFAHSASRTCQKKQWFSKVLKSKAQKLVKRNEQTQELIREHGKDMLQNYPATKLRL